MSRIPVRRLTTASIATAAVIALATACTESPTSPRDVFRPHSVPLLATNTNSGDGLYFDASSGCSYNATGGFLECPFALYGDPTWQYAVFVFHAEWDIPVHCVHEKTGKIAPSRYQPVSPFHTPTDFSNNMLFYSNVITWDPTPLTVHPGTLADSYFCPKPPYTRLVQGVAVNTLWRMHAYRLGYETVFADVSSN